MSIAKLKKAAHHFCQSSLGISVEIAYSLALAFAAFGISLLVFILK